MADFPLTDDALTQWVKRNPRMALQMRTDVGLHRQYQVNRLVLSNVERAMHAEGLAPDVRRRIINTAVFGGPDLDAVLTADQIRRMNEELVSGLDGKQIRADLLDGYA